MLGAISVRNHMGIVSVAARFRDRLAIGFDFKIVQFRRSCRGHCLHAGVTSTTNDLDGSQSQS